MKFIHLMSVRGAAFAEIIKGRLSTDAIVCSVSPSTSSVFNLHSSGVVNDALWDIYVDENKKEDALMIIREIAPGLIP